jgi:hypothetical protein
MHSCVYHGFHAFPKRVNYLHFSTLTHSCLEVDTCLCSPRVFNRTKPSSTPFSSHSVFMPTAFSVEQGTTILTFGKNKNS